MSGRDKWVRRFSVDETARHKNGFTIYKITSVLFPIESPEAVTVVSVWKRYSDVRRLHRSMVALHAGLHLRGSCPLPRSSYFRRFRREVIEERAQAIKRVLEFVAEHRLLFTSTEFVSFLQSGYEAPDGAAPGGVIAAIRGALRLPAEPAAPLEYPSDDSRSATPHPTDAGTDETDLAAIPQIPIYEATDVEIKPPSRIASFESLNSLVSLDDDLYDELNKLTVENKKSAVKKKAMLPDLINFDAPSSSRFEDYHTMPRRSDESLSSTKCSSRASLCSKSVSLSNTESKTRTEDSYVFEAGYLLNVAARCEDAGDYRRAFECYKSGIEKMLIGVQTDSDPQRRALIKDKTSKYLSYAEHIYKNHLSDAQETPVPAPAAAPAPARPGAVPAGMLRRPYSELALYRVLAVLGDSMMLVLRAESACYAMKVVQKIPNNLTEFDEYFLQRTNETRQPILPTNIPYMVPLHSYIETNNLIFLILSYAPGERLFDYIKNYVKSVPTTPARELNLENVFSEPLKKEDVKGDSEDKVIDEPESINNDEINEGDEIEVLVKNSQKLLQNVDRVLKVERGEALNTSEREQERERESERTGGGEREEENERKGGRESPASFRPAGARALPAAAARAWAAQLLAALDSLHNAGVVCRDLNPSNILLGDGGQVVLTYFVGRSSDVARTRLSRRIASGRADLYAAPELHAACGADDRLCDYWSFGAIMYELLCGVPLSHHHKSVFTSHTILTLPDDLPVEEESLLTQLLTFDPAERLGRGGVHEIQQHPYFRRVHWGHVRDSWHVPD